MHYQSQNVQQMHLDFNVVQRGIDKIIVVCSNIMKNTQHDTSCSAKIKSSRLPATFQGISRLGSAFKLWDD